MNWVDIHQKHILTLQALAVFWSSQLTAMMVLIFPVDFWWACGFYLGGLLLGDLTCTIWSGFMTACQLYQGQKEHKAMPASQELLSWIAFDVGTVTKESLMTDPVGTMNHWRVDMITLIPAYSKCSWALKYKLRPVKVQSQVWQENNEMSWKGHRTEDKP